ncbi:ArgS-related anticodon-binding protein NrtL [Streptomyces sp. NPDC002054]|uniref:ArgS-related anticodon-binding protein NrtL n=1 Tax=Streptomyces sp. NPDC002054 TaxID=3154663 RepID=UPI00331C0AE8
MNPADLSHLLVRAVRGAVEGGELGAPVPERVVVERTRPGGVGEYASALAFPLAKAAGLRPAEVARLLAGRLAGEPGIRSVEITGAGFLNFELDPAGSVERLVRQVREQAQGYGRRAEVVGGTSDPAGPVDREGVVREVVRRIRWSQGTDPGPVDGLVVAPLTRRDAADVLRRFDAGTVRWAMLATPRRETPAFGPALAVQHESNPSFQVRYAHARSRALSRNARQIGVSSQPGDVRDVPGVGALCDALGDYPLVLEAAAHHGEPERLTRHLGVIADAFLDFQYGVLPLGDEKPEAAHRARLALAEAAGTVLAGGLALLGVEAPELI